ncbi:MAG: alginate export family protein [Bacteroidota bacterium]
MQAKLKFRALLVFTVSILFSWAHGQIPQGFKNQRAEEHYDYLKDSLNRRGFNAIKYIPLGKSNNSYLSLGGAVRARYEHIENQLWIPENNESFYSQRITLHADFYVGKNLRFFGELQSGYKTGQREFLQSDDLDLHQGFVEWKSANSKFLVRAGRQELKFGAGRLVDFGLGPNVRRTFDIGKVDISIASGKIQAFYGKEARLSFGVFDNRSGVLRASDNPKLWGIYSQFPMKLQESKDQRLEVYYFGFESVRAGFSDVSGEELRHSIGTRLFGTINRKFTYNSEFVYQFGSVGNSTISAFNFETDWKYRLAGFNWRPTPGLKLDWSSGDRSVNDGRINSFNPMYVNPAIYSLAILNTPVNLLSLHPSLTLFPTKKLMAQIEYVIFRRTNKNDGLYLPPSRLNRAADGVSDKQIGNSFALFMKYSHNKHLSFDIRTSYFFAGDFIELTGSSENVFQFAATASVTF